MSNYIKLVQNKAELTAFKASNDFVTPNVTMVYNNRKIYYNPIHDYSKDYLTFVAQESGTFKFTNSINYSIDDGETWTSLSANTNTPTINAGEKIMFKATLIPSSNWPNQGIGKFSSTESFNVTGNPMSLLYGDNFIGQTNLSGKNYALAFLFDGCTNLVDAENLSLLATTLASGCYSSMFSGCTSLTTAPALPATILASNCYNSMFEDCTSLTTAPELFATTLINGCYSYMFEDCTSLTTAPTLPATTLADYCYEYMFTRCTSLTTAPELPATTLNQSCYVSMFSGCTSLTTAPVLPATTLTYSCYEYMFSGCTHLTAAPELPATTLASGCYSYMFMNCTNLNSITCLATDISAANCIYNWVYGVTANGTFTKADSMTGWTTGNSGIPSGWTVEDAS